MRIIALALSLLVSVSMAAQDFPGVRSTWEGCDRYDFKVEGRDALVVIPKEAAPGRPWIWRPAFFAAFPSVDKALLEQGWHLAYYDVTHLYGSPRAVRLSRAFYDFVVPAFKLSDKVVVEGFSRGGYMAFAWADAYPETVSSLYVDAPVCDITSWPGRHQPEFWQGFLQEWGVKDEDVDSGFVGNAINHLPRIAKAGIPIISVCGGADEGVPYKDNMEKVKAAYEAMGGLVEVIVKPDCGHHPHSLEDPTLVVGFLNMHRGDLRESGNIHRRGSLDNSLHKMTVGKEATVAFLGGSITEMEGWKDMVKTALARRFPQTSFKFIDAGISSLGSTPHAFRLEDDVLREGTPDLLFVEAAVNDHTNFFGPREQVLGMEGIVRHALRVNPLMDIVFLHFIYDPFIPVLDGGEIPDVILNHERVANHYHLNSIDLASDVASRMRSGEFDWKKFGGTHPAPFGHRVYSAMVDGLIDGAVKPDGKYDVKPHDVPEPLEADNYENGRLLPPSAAVKTKGFRLEDDWVPTDGAGTRKQYIHVPTLVCEEGGSLTLEFEGKAVGLYCTCGPNAGVLNYTIDGIPYPPLDTFTPWSAGLHIPWLHILANDLEPGRHILKLKVSKGLYPRQGCYIRNFAVN
ncbi:MAG: prolyl oligopeptidase family serine peptidase [Bacteroidales bacterium]|nr:prolyl oligopeptidase family serine peptidase [Bacteroidales bacterium]